MRIKWPRGREEALEYMVGLIMGDGVIEIVKKVVLEKFLLLR